MEFYYITRLNMLFTPTLPVKAEPTTMLRMLKQYCVRKLNNAGNDGHTEQ